MISLKQDLKLEMQLSHYMLSCKLRKDFPVQPDKDTKVAPYPHLKCIYKIDFNVLRGVFRTGAMGAFWTF